jgi:FeS assembly SUF system protein
MKDLVIAALKTVHDPEIPVNIYELGLIYSCTVSEAGVADIKMTLTAPSCPVAGILPGQVEAAVRAVPGITDVKLELVWDPPWDRDKMSDAAKLSLGFDLGFDVVPASRLGK